MLQYTNRLGDVYFLQAGKTKTGKPKYYFGKKVTETPVEAIPAGFEIRENPESGQATLRKIRPSEISPMEKEMLCEGIRNQAQLEHFIVDLDGNRLIVHLPDLGEHEAVATVNRLTTPQQREQFGVKAFTDLLITRSRYSPMMRFTLTDLKERLFCLDRWCFLGSIDDWFFVSGPASLQTLIKKYVKHLGRESFYEIP
jgi:hypothetical protein